MPKLLRWGFAIVIFIIVITWVQHRLGWHSVFASWQQVPMVSLMALGTLTFTSYLLRAYRIFHYFAVDGQPFSVYIRIHFLHNALNNLLPMRLGEASFPLLMKHHFNAGYLHTSAGLAWLRLSDLHWLLLCLSLMASWQFNTYWLLLTGTLLLLPMILVNANFPFRLPDALQQRWHMTKASLPQQPVQIAILYGMTALIWSLKLLALTVIMLSFIKLSWLQALFGVISADLSSVLPIHGLAGSGTFEAAIIAALAPLHLNTDEVLLAAVNVHLYLLLMTLLSVPVALLIPASRHSAQSLS